MPAISSPEGGSKSFSTRLRYAAEILSSRATCRRPKPFATRALRANEPKLNCKLTMGSSQLPLRIHQHHIHFHEIFCFEQLKFLIHDSQTSAWGATGRRIASLAASTRQMPDCLNGSCYRFMTNCESPRTSRIGLRQSFARNLSPKNSNDILLCQAWFWRCTRRVVLAGWLQSYRSQCRTGLVS